MKKLTILLLVICVLALAACTTDSQDQDQAISQILSGPAVTSSDASATSDSKGVEEAAIDSSIQTEINALPVDPAETPAVTPTIDLTTEEPSEGPNNCGLDSNMIITLDGKLDGWKNAHQELIIANGATLMFWDVFDCAWYDLMVGYNHENQMFFTNSNPTVFETSAAPYEQNDRALIKIHGYETIWLSLEADGRILVSAGEHRRLLP